MKNLLFFIPLFATSCFGQLPSKTMPDTSLRGKYIMSVDNLTQEAAFEITRQANSQAATLGKKITVALLDASGNIILITREPSVGPHNTEAARRKAYTALSTKTSTLELMRRTAINNDSKNLNTLPELLLLSGGAPLWYNGNVIGSIGIAGGGNAENDDLLARSVGIPELGIYTQNK